VGTRDGRSLSRRHRVEGKMKTSRPRCRARHSAEPPQDWVRAMTSKAVFFFRFTIPWRVLSPTDSINVSKNEIKASSTCTSTVYNCTVVSITNWQEKWKNSKQVICELSPFHVPFPSTGFI
jgi:hypothetical protein